MTEDERLALVREYVSVAHEHSRAAAVEQFLADDAVVSMNGVEMSVAAYRESIAESDRTFVPTETEITETVVDGDVVAVLATSTLEQTATVYGIQPDAAPIEEQYAVFHTVRDGEITRLEVVVDQAAKLRQLGVLADDPTEEALQKQYDDVLARVLRHDLRNRLNVIRLLADELADGEIEESALAGEKIREVVDDLLGTANKVRGLEQLTIGVPVEPATFRIDSLVEPLLARYEQSSCRTRYPEEIPSVTTDRTLLRNALGELVENAVVHNEGTASVAVDVRAAESPDHDWEIRIEDDGPGIPDAVLEPVREHRETDLIHGSGIGLWVAEWCSTRLDGELSFDSSELGGTCVSLRFSDLE